MSCTEELSEHTDQGTRELAQRDKVPALPGDSTPGATDGALITLGSDP